MRKTISNLLVCNSIFMTSLIITNIVSAKIVSLGGITVTAGTITYPLTFLMTDVIGEIWGREEANRSVRIGIICQLLSLAFILIAISLPIADYADNQAEFASVLGGSARMIGASLAAYICSQTWDVAVFHWLKGRTNNQKKWLRNNISTMTSQIIDTAIFIILGFYGTVPNIMGMVISQYFIKFIIALLDTPFFYWLTRNKAGE